MKAVSPGLTPGKSNEKPFVNHIYLKLMIDGAPSKAFSGVTLQPAEGI